MSAANPKFDLNETAKDLSNLIKNNFEDTYKLSFTRDPEILEKEIIEYNSRMRVFGLEKFNGPCYVSSISFYQSPKDLEAHRAVGVLILYINEEIAFKFPKILGMEASDDEEETLISCSGELVNIFAGLFKNDLVKLGYNNLTLSAPISRKNDIIEGVEFKFSEHKFYELSFYIWKEKSLVICFNIAPPG